MTPNLTTALTWRPGGAQGALISEDADELSGAMTEGEQLCCGAWYLMAVCCMDERTKNVFRRFAVVTPEEDGGFELECGEPWDMGWTDVEWYVPVKEITLPVSA